VARIDVGRFSEKYAVRVRSDSDLRGVLKRKSLQGLIKFFRVQAAPSMQNREDALAVRSTDRSIDVLFERGNGRSMRRTLSQIATANNLYFRGEQNVYIHDLVTLFNTLPVGAKALLIDCVAENDSKAILFDTFSPHEKNIVFEKWPRLIDGGFLTLDMYEDLFLALNAKNKGKFLAHLDLVFFENFLHYVGDVEKTLILQTLAESGDFIDDLSREKLQFIWLFFCRHTHFNRIINGSYLGDVIYENHRLCLSALEFSQMKELITIMENGRRCAFLRRLKGDREAKSFLDYLAGELLSSLPAPEKDVEDGFGLTQKSAYDRWADYSGKIDRARFINSFSGKKSFGCVDRNMFDPDDWALLVSARYVESDGDGGFLVTSKIPGSFGGSGLNYIKSWDTLMKTRAFAMMGAEEIGLISKERLDEVLPPEDNIRKKFFIESGWSTSLFSYNNFDDIRRAIDDPSRADRIISLLKSVRRDSYSSVIGLSRYLSRAIGDPSSSSEAAEASKILNVMRDVCKKIEEQPFDAIKLKFKKRSKKTGPKRKTTSVADDPWSAFGAGYGGGAGYAGYSTQGGNSSRRSDQNAGYNSDPWWNGFTQGRSGFHDDGFHTDPYSSGRPENKGKEEPKLDKQKEEKRVLRIFSGIFDKEYVLDVLQTFGNNEVLASLLSDGILRLNFDTNGYVIDPITFDGTRRSIEGLIKDTLKYKGYRNPVYLDACVDNVYLRLKKAMACALLGLDFNSTLYEANNRYALFIDQITINDRYHQERFEKFLEGAFVDSVWSVKIFSTYEKKERERILGALNEGKFNDRYRIHLSETFSSLDQGIAQLLMSKNILTYINGDYFVNPSFFNGDRESIESVLALSLLMVNIRNPEYKKASIDKVFFILKKAMACVLLDLDYNVSLEEARKKHELIVKQLKLEGDDNTRFERFLKDAFTSEVWNARLVVRT